MQLVIERGVLQRLTTGDGALELGAQLPQPLGSGSLGPGSGDPLARQSPPLGSAQGRPCASASLGRRCVVLPFHGAILEMFDKIVNNPWWLTLGAL